MQRFEHTLAESGLGKLRLAKLKTIAEESVLCTQNKDIR